MYLDVRPAFLSVALLATTACYELPRQIKRPHREVGSEIFRVVCMNLAAQAFPNDLTGERFSMRCDGTSDEMKPASDPAPAGQRAQRAYQRYQALLSRREPLVKALTAALEPAAYEPDELRTFLANMVPLYDPPGEELPQLTRAAAALLESLVDPENQVAAAAVAAFERLSARQGYRPARFDLAFTRTVLSYPRLDDLVRTLLAAIAPGGPARREYEALLRAAAWDLATAEGGAPDPARPGTLTLATDLLLKEDAAFAGLTPSAYLTLRDPRGVARPVEVLPPFQDRDGDQRVDIDERGGFVLQTGASAPTPYLTLDSAATDDTPRDEAGRATDGSKQGPVYRSVDATKTLLAALLRDARPLLERAKDEPAPILDLLYGLNGLLGDYEPRTQASGDARLSYEGPNTEQSPLFDFVHALASVLPFDESVPLLKLVEELVSNPTHESALAGLVEAALYIDERSDAYPDAKLSPRSDFWDDMIEIGRQVAEAPGLQERILRSFTAEETAQLGAMLSSLLRFKDRTNYPLGSMEELKALGIHPRDVVGKLDEQTCTGSDCGRPCDLATPCAEGHGCVVEQVVGVGRGVCGTISQAVAAHRINTNSAVDGSCSVPPQTPLSFLECPARDRSCVDDPDAGCLPLAPYPAPHHRGIRDCPGKKPADGASCGGLSGVGLCSWDEGSCTCSCEGGLCRHGAVPTWACKSAPTPGYAQWVERAAPDDRVSADGHSNQSLFQRSIALIYDLHHPNRWTTFDGALVRPHDPAGSNLPAPLTVQTLDEQNLAGVLSFALDRLGSEDGQRALASLQRLLGGLGVDVSALLGDLTLRDVVAALGPFPEGRMLDEPNLAILEARSILNLKDKSSVPARFTYLNPDLEQLLDTLFPRILGYDKNALMERQTQIRGLRLSGITPHAIARVAFTPFNKFLSDLLAPIDTRDGLSFQDLHKDTVTSWELKDPIGGAGYYDVLAPLLSALDANGAAGPTYLDLYGDFISTFHRHWSSPASDATTRACDDTTTPPTCDESAPLFSLQSNAVSYEELLAEALLDAQIVARLRDVLLACAKIQVRLLDGRTVDGITVLAETLNNLLLADRSCVAGDCEAAPLRYRDGRTSTTTNSGRPIAQASPLYLLLDSLNGLDAHLAGSRAGRLGPWRRARSKLIDTFFEVERSGPGAFRFANPHTLPAARLALSFAREQVEKYASEQSACLRAGRTPASCQQLRDWAFGLVARFETSLSQPVAAALLRLLDRLRELDSDPAGKLMELSRYLVNEQPGDSAFAATALGTADLLQVLEDTQNLGPIMVFLSRAIGDNALQVGGGGAERLELEKGFAERALALLRSLQSLDSVPGARESALAHLLARLGTEHGERGEAPLDVIVDAIAAVNRASPGATGSPPLDTRDLRALLHETAEFLGSERHGLERLYDVVRARDTP